MAAVVRFFIVVAAIMVGAVGGFLLAIPVALSLAWALTATGVVEHGPDDEGGSLLGLLFLMFLITVPAGAILTGRSAWRRLARAGA